MGSRNCALIEQSRVLIARSRKRVSQLTAVSCSSSEEAQRPSDSMMHHPVAAVPTMPWIDAGIGKRRTKCGATVESGAPECELVVQGRTLPLDRELGHTRSGSCER